MKHYKLSDIVIEINERENDPSSSKYDRFVGLEHYVSGDVIIRNYGSTELLGSSMKVFRAGDVLVARRNVYLKRAATVDFDGLTSGDSIVLRAKSELFGKILPFILNTDEFWDYADKYSDGTMSKRLSPKVLMQYEFDLPDDDKLIQLVDILWASNEAKESYRKLLHATDDLVKSQFIEMFYGKGYPIKTIGDVIDKKIARVAKVFEKTDKIQYLDISSIDNVSKKVTGLTTYTLSDAPSRAQYILKAGDILYSTVRPNLQNIAINPYNEDNIIGSTGFCVLRCSTVRTGYLWGVVNSILFTDAMVKKASGANYPAVTDKVVHAYEIPIPPEEAQIAYEQLIKQSDKSKFVIDNYINKKYGKIRRYPDVYRI